LTNPFDGISTNRYAHPTFVDIDADGDMDLFVGGYYDNSTDYYLLQYFKNTGTASNPVYVNGSTLFPTHPLLEGGVVNNLSRNSISSPISFADLDQDGDLDFFISIYGEIIYYRNDNGSFKIQYGYNGDATQVGPWIPNPGNPGSSQGNPFDAINNDLPGGIDYLSFAFADLDNDGDMDVTVGYNEYSYYSNVEKALFYYENKGLGVLELKEGLESPVDGVDLKNHSNVSFADIDGDGDLDALTSGSEVQNKYGISSTYTYQELYKNDNGVFSLVTDPQQNPFSNLSFIGDANLKLFDLDKDGDLDLIAPYHVNDSYYSEAKVQYFQNNAGIYTELTGVNNPFDFINEGPGFEPDVDLGDLNGDGKPDLVLSRSNSRLELFENSGTLANPIFSRKMEWETGFTNNPSSENHSKFLDLDHDGDLDIIVGKYQGFWYYENIGSPETPSFLLYNALSNSNPFKGMEINSFPVNIHSPAFADLDNDGDQDLFSGDNTGQFSFFENTNPAPITGVIPNLNFTQGINPVVLDANLTISDSDNDQIVKAEVTILNFRPGDEVLSYTPDEAIDGVFNATTGILTLTGLDPSGVNSPFPLPISYFQSALRSVKYQFIGSAPTGGRLSSGRTADAVLDRSITFSVLDQDFTTPAIKTMALQITFLSSNQPPVINPITAQVAVGNSVLIDFTSLISDPNNNLDPTSFRVIQDPLSGASYTISNFVVNLDYANLDFVGQDQFTIEICDLLGACTTSLVTIDVAGDIIVYNGFSPNPDSYNPYFRIANISVFEPENKVSIFNRWGSEVFEVDNYNNDTNRFEGKNNNGNELPSGTYFYKIEFTSGRETMTGYLTLKK
jgi:gliding motility-associated-like protein